eukprot:TRINITY_DN44587_c0_g1_i1.p1 TRINITY_DN44587_c0_g1~~TRINITY_DN44587_c0_g1_i1.p1  ORF type:complete len:785 (+),score=137.65 TRINITY_DN44587_c0_g1_i1:102-2456(+)
MREIFDSYRIVPPGGGSNIIVRIEVGTSIADAYVSIASGLGCSHDDLTLLLRNPPGCVLPFFHIFRNSESTLRSVAPPGSVLVAELPACRDVVSDDTNAPRGTSERDATLVAAAVAAPAPAPATIPAPSSKPTATVMPAERRGLTGLRNLGNTCYLNSAVQCISQTRALTEGLVGVSADSAIDSKRPVAEAYVSLLRSLWSDNGGDALSPWALKRSIADQVRTFEGSGQQDAQELVQVLLEALHKDFRRTPPTATAGEDLVAADTPVDGGDSAAPQTVSTSSSQAVWDKALREDSSLVSDLFQGQLRSSLRCERCGRVEVSFELFWSLQVPVPPVRADGQAPSLQDAVDNFCVEEALEEGSWQCPACQVPARAFKKFDLWRLPPILLIHLKRFNWAMPAASGAIAIPKAASPPTTAAESKIESAPLPLHALSAASVHAAASATVVISAAATTPTPPLQLGSGEIAKEVTADALSVVEPSTAPTNTGTSPRMTTARATLPSPSPGSERSAVVAEVSPESAFEVAAVLPWPEQEAMYALVIRLLRKIVEAPNEPKFRSVGKSSARLRKDVLDVGGDDARGVGAALMRWAGFQDDGDRFSANDLGAAEADEQAVELERRAKAEQFRHLRRVRDERIAEEKRRLLPTGESERVRRWGGRLPAFGRGYFSFSSMSQLQGLACSKVSTRVALTVDAGRARGCQAVPFGRWVVEGSPEASGAKEAEYELYGVVEHIGHTPFSGHYVANCWHDASKSWWNFNDATVSRVSGDHCMEKVLGSGSYLLFLERCV